MLNFLKFEQCLGNFLHGIDVTDVTHVDDMTDVTHVDDMTDVTHVNDMIDLTHVDDMTDVTHVDNMTDVTHVDDLTDVTHVDDMTDVTHVNDMTDVTHVNDMTCQYEFCFIDNCIFSYTYMYIYKEFTTLFTIHFRSVTYYLGDFNQLLTPLILLNSDQQYLTGLCCIRFLVSLIVLYEH